MKVEVSRYDKFVSLTEILFKRSMEVANQSTIEKKTKESWNCNQNEDFSDMTWHIILNQFDVKTVFMGI